MLRQFSHRRVVAAFTCDWLCTLFALLVATAMRASLEGGQGVAPSAVDSLRTVLYHGGYVGDRWAYLIQPPVIVLVAVLWPAVLLSFGVYDGRRIGSFRRELFQVGAAVWAASLTLAGLLFLTYRGTSRSVFVAFTLIDLFLLYGVRMIWAAYRALAQGKMSARERIVIIGAGQVGRRLAEQLRQLSNINLAVLGFVDDDESKMGEQIEDLPVLGSTDALATIVEQNCVTGAVVALPLWAHKRIVSVCTKLQGLNVRAYVVPDLFAVAFPNASLDLLGDIPILSLGEPGISGWKRFWKRTADMVLSAVLLVITAPVFCVVAIAIKLDSRGPVFYGQERIGLKKRPFRMLKFRSMCANADESVHREHVRRLMQRQPGEDEIKALGNVGVKLANDTRVTRVGRVLRRTSLDELPQLLNVLRGEMSLVGPRPPLPYETELYQDWHWRRLLAPPGITGLWQVTARNQVSFDDMVRLDLSYIDRQSFWTDVAILLKTARAVVSGKGAR